MSETRTNPRTRLSRLLLATIVALAFDVRNVAAQEQADAGVDQREVIGTVHFPTTCAPAVAPRMDRATALLHSFEFGATLKALDDVLASDSTCAMAYWARRTRETRRAGMACARRAS